LLVFTSRGDKFIVARCGNGEQGISMPVVSDNTFLLGMLTANETLQRVNQEAS